MDYGFSWKLIGVPIRVKNTAAHRRCFLKNRNWTENCLNTVAMSPAERSKRIVMAGVMLAMLLGALDQTIVSTAMPQVVRDLNGLEHLSWVFTSYMLASTVTVPIYGKLSDLYGRRGFYLSGIVIFLLGSMLSNAPAASQLRLHASYAEFLLVLKQAFAASIGYVYHLGRYFMIVAFVTTLLLPVIA